MTTNQLGEGKYYNACYDCEAHCLIFIRLPLVSLVPVQWDQNPFPRLICTLLLFSICCYRVLWLWLNFLHSRVMRAVTLGPLEPYSVVTECKALRTVFGCHP